MNISESVVESAVRAKTQNISDFSSLPAELVCLVLYYTSGIDEKESTEAKFADFGDDLLHKVWRSTHGLFSLRCEPAQKWLNIVRAVSKKVDAIREVVYSNSYWRVPFR